MDRNSIIGLVLIAAILIGYQLWTSPSQQERERFQRQQDSLAQVLQEKAAADAERNAAQAEVTLAKPDTAIALVPDTGHVADSLRLTKLNDRFGPFAAAAQGNDQVVTIENEHLQVSINTFGAKPDVIRLKEYTTYQKEPLLLADPDSGRFEYRFFLGNRDISTKDLHFTAEKLGTTGVRLTAPTGDAGRYLAITYQLDSAKWFMDLTAEVVGMPEIDPRNMMFQWDLVGIANEKHLPT
ncbi:MAG TPA: YidC/Oxa1 family insertase periplasmic-domain containing protein, partial [Flavobacteriales bacterium]|nr:YidC/Oxa1 family insertase periplasmic-domain containing protein [Flavobacteriales bacterium]